MERQVRELAARVGTPVEDSTVWWSVKEAMTISSAILIFGVLVMGLMVFLTFTRAKTRTLEVDQLLRLFVTPLIIILAVFLVVAGYSDKQISPVIGLLGTIAGYLLGKAKNQRNEPAGKDAAPTASTDAAR
jgi:hypothetical protein